jgi:cell wall assembly regulator SMI1
MTTKKEYDVFWERIENVFKVHAPGLLAVMNPPASEQQLLEVEAELGYGLHSDVREAYLRHDGSLYPEGNSSTAHCQFPMFDSMAVWMPLSVALETWRRLKSSYATIRRSAPGMFPEPAEWWADLHVRPVSWDERHFPIGDTSTSYNVFVDMIPAGKGQVGQIFGDDGTAEDQPLLAPSFNILLGTIADHLETGAVGFGTKKRGFFSAKTGNEVYQFYPDVVSRDSR